MAKFDAFVEYNTNSSEFFRKTVNDYKSFVKLKFGYVLDKTKELEGHKNLAKNNKYLYSIGDIEKSKQVSGIFETQDEATKHIRKLPPCSFIVWTKFKLKAPYFSKDDDDFYVIQNPVLKEKAFKVPMVRGSGWKGALASAFKELMNVSLGNKKLSLIESYFRIFGAGSESIKEIEDNFRKKLEGKNLNLKELKEKVVEVLLFELGISLDKKTISEIRSADKNNIFQILEDKLSQKVNQIIFESGLPIELQTHKGRAIFYPTYFDKLSLEIINPHDRRKRAGTNPIHYEVVPKDTEGILQIIYIPFNTVLKEDNELKEEVKQDLDALIRAVEKLQNKGIGAKTKLGWGSFKLTEKHYCINGNIEITDEIGWSKCQG